MESLEDKVLRVNWPEKSGEYKVVQLEVDGQPYLRFPSEKYQENSHGAILMILFNELNIKYEEIRGYSGSEIPALEGERYKVHGMGKVEVSIEQKQANLFGDSFDYGVGINREHLGLIRILELEWDIREKD